MLKTYSDIVVRKSFCLKPKLPIEIIITILDYIEIGLHKKVFGKIITTKIYYNYHRKQLFPVGDISTLITLDKYDGLKYTKGVNLFRGKGHKRNKVKKIRNYANFNYYLDEHVDEMQELIDAWDDSDDDDY